MEQKSLQILSLSRWKHFRIRQDFIIIIIIYDKETPSCYILGAHRVKPPLLCDSSQTTQVR